MVDFNRSDKHGVEGKIKAIEYDPYRTSNIILVVYKDGDKRYHLAPQNVKEGKVRTYDMGGNNTTLEVANYIGEKIENSIRK